MTVQRRRRIHSCMSYFITTATTGRQQTRTPRTAGWNPLHDVRNPCSSGGYWLRPPRYQVVRFLLKAGSSVQARDSDGNSVVYAAASGGHPAVVQEVPEAGADVSIRNREGFTPMMSAVQNGRVDMLRWFLKRGLNDINDTCCVNGMGPLFLAAEYASVDMVESVIEAGGDVHARTFDGRVPLHAAARHGNAGMVKALVRAGSDPAS
ncbi:unnamed protein product [Pylaiella littoralis]